MAKRVRVLLGFSKMKEDALATISGAILKKMKESPHFSDPVFDLIELQRLVDDYWRCLVRVRKTYSRIDKALKDESKVRLIRGLQVVGSAINFKYIGEKSILLSSGFPILKDEKGADFPTAVIKLRLKDGAVSGQLLFSFDRQVKILLYEYCYRKVEDGLGESAWSDLFITTSSRSNIISGLEIGKFYAVRVRAVNRKGIGDWSEEERIMVR